MNANVAAMMTGILPLASNGDGGFHGPTLEEFFPAPFLFIGTPFEMNRVMMIRLIATVVLCALFLIGTRRMRLVPTRGQSVAELAVNFAYQSIAVEVLGEKRGRRYAPVITIIFFAVLAMNLTGIVPGLNLAGSSVVGLPFVIAMISWFTFVIAGIREQGGWHFLKSQLFPPGVPWPIYIILTPIEIISTFLLRPATLTIRLLANMMSGHFLLVLCFSATHFLFLEAAGALKAFGVLTLSMGVVFTLFELFIAALQAYIFALLTAVYIQLSTEAH